MKSQAYVISIVQMVRFITNLKVRISKSYFYKKVSSFALIIVSSVMIHSPKNFIAIETKSETSKEHRILEVGENAIECKHTVFYTQSKAFI